MKSCYPNDDPPAGPEGLPESSATCPACRYLASVSGRRWLALLSVLLLSTFASLFLLAFRRVLSGVFQYGFLRWNLFLAWIPFWFALALFTLHRSGSRRVGLMAVTGVLWLAFFPNAPYIVTDSVHLAPTRTGEYWCDLILVMTFAWNGMLLGFLSLYLVQRVVRERKGKISSWLVTVAALGLGSFGISLGRFQRWNTWDLWHHPMNLFWDVFVHLRHPGGHPRAFGMAAVLFAFLLLAYLAVLAIMWVGQAERDEGGRGSAGLLV